MKKQLSIIIMLILLTGCTEKSEWLCYGSGHEVTYKREGNILTKSVNRYGSTNHDWSGRYEIFSERPNGVWVIKGLDKGLTGTRIEHYRFSKNSLEILDSYSGEVRNHFDCK